LKKRTKKLLLVGSRGPFRIGPPTPTSKGFLLLFFKKRKFFLSLLWRYEIANGLQMAVRRKRIDAGFRDRALKHLAALDVRIDAESEAHVWA
jgi:hypothetical protein